MSLIAFILIGGILILLIILTIIMASQADLIIKVNAIATQVAKIDLDVQAILDAEPQASPELEAAVTNLQEVVQSLDDGIEEAPPATI